MKSETFAEIKERYPSISFDCKYISCGEGWNGIIFELIRTLDSLNFKGIIVQVKEKWGRLECYTRGGEEHSEWLIPLTDTARLYSKSTCEFCGKPGELREKYQDGTQRNWMKSVCDSCNKNPHK